jgi:hypothetical protein
MEGNEEVNRILVELSDIMDELPMARYWLEDSMEELENVDTPGADWDVVDDARSETAKAEANWERLNNRKEELESRVIRELGEPGTLTTFPRDTTVVVLLDNQFLVNGEIVYDVESMVFKMYNM